MHLRNEGLLFSQVLSGGLKNLNPHREVTTVVIHIYFLALHKLFFILAYLLFCICLALIKERSLITAYKILKPHVNKSTVCKHLRKYSLWWHKNKNTERAYFFFYVVKNILNGHLAKILPKENLSKPTRTTNL